MPNDKEVQKLKERIAVLEDTVFTLQVLQKRLLSRLDIAEENWAICRAELENSEESDSGRYMQ